MAVQYGIACILNICILCTPYVVCTTEIVSSMLVFVRVQIKVWHMCTCTFPLLTFFLFFLREKLLVSQFHVCPCRGLNDFFFQNLLILPSCRRPVIKRFVTLETVPVMAMATMLVLAVPVKTALVTMLVMLNWHKIWYLDYCSVWKIW